MRMCLASPKLVPVVAALACVALPACHQHHDAHEHHERHKVVLTSPKAMDVTVTQQYVCKLHSQRHINVRALQAGYLESIQLKEGQAVKQGDVLFRVLPTLYKAKLDAELAEARLAQLEFNNTKRLADAPQPVVSPQEVALAQAKLDKANAKAKLAQSEVDFTIVRAPFDGIIDRLHEQQGSLIKEGDVLTTLSDNSMMWAYFNVPEARYLDYKAGHDDEDPKVELTLANGRTFPHAGAINAIEADFNSETGNIPFRADFANPDRLLRHGQTGNIHIHRTLKGAVVIPQRATFEVLDKRYAFVVDPAGVARQREIAVAHEKDDIFVVTKGLTPADRIVLEGVQQVQDGKAVEDPEFRKPDEALAHQKQHAE